MYQYITAYANIYIYWYIYQYINDWCAVSISMIDVQSVYQWLMHIWVHSYINRATEWFRELPILMVGLTLLNINSIDWTSIQFLTALLNISSQIGTQMTQKKDKV